MRIAVALFLFVACDAKITMPTKVDVNCETTKEGLDCTVKQTAGTTEAEACWDFIVTCANGAVVKAPRLCQKVKDGGTAKISTTKDKLEGIEKCGGEGGPTAKVENLTIDGKTPDFVTPTTNK